ncbi:hypothetical protein D3C80_1681900 [compost metagenome]
MGLIVLLQGITIQQTRGRGGVHCTVTAMDMFGQQWAGLVAVNTDAVPAIVDGLGIFMGHVQ